jgi:Zn-dependent peptidase ImmA (M78 family)/transcriptional regulator with XRE-family HTH domain
MDILKLIGQRLKEARETCGFKQEEVAQKIGITREYLSLLENGKRNPPLRMLQKLAELYGCPVSYFYGFNGTKGESFKLLLRKAQKQSLSPEVISQLRRFEFLCREIASLRQRLGIPKPELPTYPVTKEALEKQAKEAAEAERMRLGLGDDPVPNLAEVLEDEGIPVIRLPLNGEVSGAMAYDEDLGGFLLVNSNEPSFRQNWSVAHEYAHLLKDRGKGAELEKLSRDDGGEGQERERRQQSLAERFADRFATHFLLPESTVRRLAERYADLDNAWALMSLRRIFGVSYPALLYRLCELGYLRERDVAKWQQENLCRLERRLFGEREDHLDQPIQVSKVLWELVLEAARRDEISRSYAAEVLGISPMEVQDILYELEAIRVGGQS